MKSWNFFKSLILIPALGLAVSCDNPDNDMDNDTVINDEEVRVEDENYRKDREQREKDAQKFVAEAASIGMLEVKMAELAQTQSKNAEVKALAQNIKSDHEKANQELKSIVGEKKWTLPNEMNDSDREEMEDLQDESAQEFDMEFLEAMIESHSKAIDMFEKEAENFAAHEQKYGDREKTASGANTMNDTASTDHTGDKMELRKWINQQLPTLRAHLKSSRELEEKLEAQKK